MVRGAWLVVGVLACGVVLVGVGCAGRSSETGAGPASAGAAPAPSGEDRFARVNSVARDREVWQSLLSDHASIRRVVRYHDWGVEATTESDDPDVAARIQDHAGAMHERMKVGAAVRVWDPVFAELFEAYEAVTLEVTPTERGVRIVERSEDPRVVALLWSHAAGVSTFVREGHGAGGRATARIEPGTPPPDEVSFGGIPHRVLLGQPTAEQVAMLPGLGVEGVVNFRKPSEHEGYDEGAAATSAGLAYQNIAYAGSEVSPEVIERSRGALRDSLGRGSSAGLALHCRTGNRVGPGWIAWRVLDGGASVDRAVAEARAFGLKDAGLEAAARAYVSERQKATP